MKNCRKELIQLDLNVSIGMLADVSWWTTGSFKKKSKTLCKVQYLNVPVYIYFFEVNDAVEEATCK